MLSQRMCAAGTYSAEDAAACTTCQQGHESDPGAAACKKITPAAVNVNATDNVNATEGKYSVAFKSGVGGFTKDTFVEKAQNVYKDTLTETFLKGGAVVDAGKISLSDIADFTSARRRLSSATVTGVTFDVEVADVADNAQQVVVDTVKKIASNNVTFVDAFKAALKTNFETEGIVGFNSTLFDSFDIASKTTEATVTSFVPGDTDDSGSNSIGLALGVGVGVPFLLYILYLCRKHHMKRDEAKKQVPPSNVAQGSVQKFVAGPEGTASSLV